MFNSRHLRVWSWQSSTPTVAGDWQARAVVTSTASPLSSSWPMPRRPRRPPPPRPSSPLPKLKYKSWNVKTITYNWHRLGWKSCKCQITSNQKSYLLAGWHLEFLGEGQLKKTLYLFAKVPIFCVWQIYNSVWIWTVQQWVNWSYLSLTCLWLINSCTIIVMLQRNALHIDICIIFPQNWWLICRERCYCIVLVPVWQDQRGIDLIIIDGYVPWAIRVWLPIWVAGYMQMRNKHWPRTILQYSPRVILQYRPRAILIP